MNHLLDVRVLNQNQHLNVVYSKEAMASGQLDAQVLQMYHIISKQFSKHVRENFEEIKFTFGSERQLKVSILKKGNQSEDYNIAELSDKIDEVKAIEEDLIDAVDELANRTWPHTDLMHIGVLKKGEHLNTFYSTSLTKLQSAEIKEKIIKIYQSVMQRLGDDAEEVAKVDFAFTMDKKVKVTLIKKDQSKVEIDPQFIVEENEQVDQLFNVIEHIRKASFSKRPRTYSFLQKFTRFILYYLVVAPVVRESTNQALKKLNSEKQISNLYISPYALYEEIKNQLLEKRPQLFELFEENDIRLELQEQLVAAIQLRLPQLGLSKWNHIHLQQLDVLRVVQHLKMHTFDSNEHLFEELRHLNPLEVPFRELKKIPLTPSNQIQLALTWKSVIEGLFNVGHLDAIAIHADAKTKIEQTNCAIAYLNALNHLPQAVKDIPVLPDVTLEQFCAQLNAKQSSYALKDLVVQQGREMELEEPSMRKARHLYATCILPVLSQMKLEAHNILTLTDCLMAKSSELIDLFIKSANGKQEQLSSRYKRYSHEQLRQIFYNQVEKIALVTHHLTAPQLESIRRVRNEAESQNENVQAFQTLLEKYNASRVNVDALEIQLLEKQRLLAYPHVSLPAYDLPLHLIDKTIKESIVNEYKAGLEKNLQELDGEIAQLKQQLDVLKEDLLSANRARHYELNQKREKIKRQLDQHLIPRQKEMQLLLDAKKTNDGFEKLLPAHLKISASTLHMAEIDTSYLHRLNSVKAALEQSSPKNDGQIAALQSALDKIQAFQIEQAKILPLQKEINDQLQALNAQFIEEIDQLVRAPSMLEALAAISQKGIRREQISIVGLMWARLLEHAFVQIDPLKSQMDEDFKKKSRFYMQAKGVFFSLNLRDLNDRIQTLITQQESAIERPLVKSYLEKLSYYQTNSNEVLFSDSILEQVSQEKSHYSTFTALQQVQMMFLNKIFNKIANKQLITSEDKTRLKLILEAMRKDKSFKEQVSRYHDSVPTMPQDRFVDRLPKLMRGFVGHHILHQDKGPKPQIEGGIADSTLKFLQSYLSQSKNLDEMQQVKELNSKTENLLAKLEKGAEIVSKERLTLKELGILSRSERLVANNFIEQMAALGVLEVDQNLKQWTENAKQTKELFDRLNARIVEPAFKAHYKSGSLLAHSIRKKKSWMGRSPSSQEQLIAYVSNGLTHGAKLYNQTLTPEQVKAARKGEKEVPKEGIYISQIVGNYQQDPLNLFEVATSDIWEIDVVPLIDPVLQESLKQIYGENWQATLNTMYQEIEKRMHMEGNRRFIHLKNNEMRRVKAGLANHPWLYLLLGQRDIQGHQREVQRDFNKVHRKFFQEGALKEEQICSEFASKATLAAMLELNKQLTQQIKTHLKITSAEELIKQCKAKGQVIDEDVKEYLTGKRQFIQEDMAHSKKSLKLANAKRIASIEKKLIHLLQSIGKTPKEINLFMHLNNEEVLELPYKHERMKAIHPGRMAKILTDRGCARLVPPPPKLMQFIDFSK
jgi:hypothetical protein